MKKSIIVDFLSGTPSSTYSVSTGYSVGSEWINTNNGNRFYHKTDGNWVPLNVESFYIQGGTSSAFDTTSDIYRTGSLNIGTGTATDGRFVVSSITGSVSFVVDNNGSIYNYSTSSNTKFGYLSLQNNTTGSNNTAFGTGSLYSNTSGGYNTAYGASSLYNNSTGVSTFVLSNPGSGYTMSTTFSNVQLSYISGSTASTYPTVTVFVGVGGTVSTVTLVTTGTGFIDNTTVMGTNLGGSGTTFSINVLTISSGRYNTGVGAYSLGLNTTGPWNTAIGYGSLYNNISGNSNTAVGYQSLNQNTTGPASVAIGLQSLYNNTTGQQNTALGYRSLYLNSVGSFNIAIGTRALYSNIADKNTVVGGETMYSNLTGTFNTALGQESLRANIAGSYNTAVGTFALLNSESNYTVAVGRDAGRYSSVGNLIASTESLFLGYNSKSLTASSTNEIVIGASASGNGSNSATLGSDSITKTILKGNVGIGLTEPSTKLHIFATQSGAFRLEDGTQSYPGYVLTSDANGVGTWQGNTQITLSGPTATALASWNNTTIMCNRSGSSIITIPDTGLPPNFSFRFIVISSNVSATISFTYSSSVSILPNTLLTFAQYESGVIDRFGTSSNYYITF